MVAVEFEKAAFIFSEILNLPGDCEPEYHLIFLYYLILFSFNNILFLFEFKVILSYKFNPSKLLIPQNIILTYRSVWHEEAFSV